MQKPNPAQKSPPPAEGVTIADEKARTTPEGSMVARQPVFDRQGRIWGYQLLFRDALKKGEATPGSPAATSTLMMEGFELMRPLLRGDQRFLIPFSGEFLEQELPSILPPECCAIQIMETVTATSDVLMGLINLKKQGYLMVLGDFAGQQSLAPFLRLADVIKIDVTRIAPKKLKLLAEGLSRHLSAKLLAENVEERKMAALCHALGFTLFQGYFFSKPEIVAGKSLSPAQTANTQTLLGSAGPDMTPGKIAQMISSDIYLSYRLLKYINSVYFGMPMQVQTVEHAVSLLGLQKVKQWLIVTSMAGLEASPMSQEIVFMAAFRAKFLQNLAQSQPSLAGKKDVEARFFLAGLFSLLDSMLQMPLDDIFASLPIDEQVREALTKNTGPLAPWYQLMMSYDQGRWNDINKLSGTLKVSDKDLLSAYSDAADWTRTLFASLSPEQAEPGN